MLKVQTRYNLSAFHMGYFVLAFIEIIAEFFSYQPIIMVLKPMIPLQLMLFYYLASPKRNIVFFITMFFSALTNLLFIPNTPQMLLLGVIAFLIHRLFIIYFISRLVQLTDFIPAIIGTIPILVIFSYLLSITTEIPENTFWLLMIQNILIAILGGITFSTYLINDSKENSWLLLSGLLFVALQFIVFIEKYYLSGISPIVFRPIAMALNAFAFFMFYRFAIAKEVLDCDRTSV